jgi:hypothetical protein
MRTKQSDVKIVAASGVLHFQEVALWRHDKGRRAVIFSAFTDKDEIMCVVSDEFLEDTYGDTDDVLVTALDHADEITEKIGSMIARSLFDAGGSVVLRSIPR